MVSYVDKVIKDRNGNDKTIRVAIQDSIADNQREHNELDRGLEFGWTTRDSAPDDDGASSRRQAVQDFVESAGWSVLARHVMVLDGSIPLVFDDGEAVYVVTWQPEPELIGSWKESNSRIISKVVRNAVFGIYQGVVESIDIPAFE